MECGCERLYGYSREEALGKNAHELLKTEFPQPLGEISAELEKKGQWEGELVQTGRAGNRIVVVSRWVRHRFDENRPPVVLQISNDISACRQAEEALRQAYHNKDRFLATIAHELRNPLAAMLNSVELLRRPVGNGEEIDRTIDILQLRIRNLLRLVDDLLDFEYLAHGTIALQKTRVRLSDIVEAAMEMCRPLIDPNSHHLRMSLPREPVTLEADARRITQVIANLVHNAFKYTPPDGCIELAAEVQNGEVIIRIRDTGVGISAEVLPHIFDMYEKGAASSGIGIKGLGIGLALVRQLVGLHGGSVTVHSEGLQKGSEFVVRLPLVEDSTVRQHEGSTQVAVQVNRSSDSDT